MNPPSKKSEWQKTLGTPVTLNEYHSLTRQIAFGATAPNFYLVVRQSYSEHGLMRWRIASINDLPIQKSERKYHWILGCRPDAHPGLSDLNL